MSTRPRGFYGEVVYSQSIGGDELLIEIDNRGGAWIRTRDRDDEEGYSEHYIPAEFARSLLAKFDGAARLREFQGLSRPAGDRALLDRITRAWLEDATDTDKGLDPAALRRINAERVLGGLPELDR